MPRSRSIDAQRQTGATAGVAATTPESFVPTPETPIQL
jgi:hypothetical protein